MGVHRDRLGGSKAHRLFSKGMKTLFQDCARELFGRRIPLSTLSPRDFGGVLLPIPVPPMFEEAFGYQGTLRFVEFSYSKAHRQLLYCDGGDLIPSNKDLWIRFLRHPVVAPHLPKSRYPTLYGVIPNGKPPLKAVWKPRKRPESAHCLLLDREKRELYLCKRDRTILFLALKEPEDADRHWAYIDSRFYPVNPDAEDYKTPPRKEVGAELLQWLDEKFKLSQSQVDP